MTDAASVLDLSTAIPAESAVVEILYPGTSKPTGWKIEIAGPAHPKTIAMTNDAARERLNKERAIEFAQINGRKWKTDDETPEDRARRNVTRLVGRIIGWSPDPVFRNVQVEPIVFSEKAAVDLLLREDMGWVLSQIADYITSETAFTQASATT